MHLEFLCHKWRILFRPIEVKIETAIVIVKAVCVLHNYLRLKKCDQLFLNLLQEKHEQPNLGAFENLANDARRSTNAAFNAREKFVSYFNN